ncbi:vitamin B12 transporter [Pseudoduganella lurida]|uniref:Vitamin B12 transporter n=1 Tax=Pseudoduganella lurida TaxID=1036180 RepID=A0A562QVK5_9BURK|nr:TonB-dependent receptor [Pseudoduganella lurida]TWI60344.1 vitamin B12 transporter [Pseudoduganella lurida]
MTSPVALQAARKPLAVSISLALSFAVFAPAAFAQASSVGAVAAPNADTVIVTAGRTPQLARDVISDTTVITAEEIARSGAGSITELLQRQRGIEVARNGGPGTNASVFIRGANSNQNIVLVDGVRIGSATTGTASWNAIPLSAIDRIEIVYGPLSTLYGADAIGGVIQLFTKKGAGAPAVTATVGGGSDKTYKADAGVSGGTDKISYALAAGKERSDGFSATRKGTSSFNPDDDGYDRKTASGKFSLQVLPGHELGATFLYSDLTADYDSANFAAYSTQTLSTVAAYSRNEILPNWTSLVQVAQSRDKSGSVYGIGAFGFSQINTKQDLYSWQNDFRIGDDNLQVLGEYRHEEVASNNADIARERHTKSIAATYSARRGNHLLNVGARYDDNSDYGSKNTGSVGYAYRITPALTASASFGTSFRAPTYNELYYSGYGNPANRPEEGRNAEAAVRYDDGKTQLGAVYFHNKLTDLLLNTTPCPFPSDAKNNYQYGCAYNVNHALLEGLSLSAAHQLGALLLGASADFQQPKDETTGKLLQRRAKRHASLTAEYGMGPLTAGAEWQLSSSRFDDAANRNTLAGYGVVNLYGTYRLAPDWSVLLRVNNVADKNYELARYYQTGGRTAFASLRYGFK